MGLLLSAALPPGIKMKLATTTTAPTATTATASILSHRPGTKLKTRKIFSFLSIALMEPGCLARPELAFLNAFWAGLPPKYFLQDSIQNV